MENLPCIYLCKECSHIKPLVVAKDRSPPGTTLGDLLSHVEDPGRDRNAADFWEDRDRGWTPAGWTVLDSVSAFLFQT